ncbi:alpha/beta fold hydrolase [Rhodococcus sp. NCIMB 12038]|uniref:alpha/beta fold hydrolase n=1 Tax=Rhodococcus sp. NCIMB 12038 TaxID=933800 RepID=UPI000B3C75CB|nr:alpha/beta fold hydrolase [Rhodococcus sp. NCIMB 12038]OUS91388.1 hypothetical protein CA951_33475 [Rhodococcus sp. NCIMB 12038]
MWVEWEAPATTPAHPLPVILVHGGGGQGTDWMITPDGRPGWAPNLVDNGFEVYVVDRPGHGRSPNHPQVLGRPGAPFPAEAASSLFAPSDAADTHTRWPWGRSLSDPEMVALRASTGHLLADLSESQCLDGERLASLLDLVGPAILITHSAGAPSGWLAADLRPDLVAGILAVEPIGPPFAGPPGLAPLRYGLTAAPLRTDPPLPVTELPARVGEYCVSGLRGTPVRVVTGGASPAADGARAIAAHLEATGADTDHLHLPDEGIDGNGHGLIFESNSRELAALATEWLTTVTQRTPSTGSRTPLSIASNTGKDSL